jgi:hypothetical protein
MLICLCFDDYVDLTSYLPTCRPLDQRTDRFSYREVRLYLKKGKWLLLSLVVLSREEVWWYCLCKIKEKIIATLIDGVVNKRNGG